MHVRERRWLSSSGRVHAGALLVLTLALAVGACGGGAAAVPPPSTTTGGSAPPEETSEAPEDSATLDVLSDDPADVLLDGKPIGKTPITGYKVHPGNHDITFVDERTGNRTMTVTVGPNEGQVVKAPSRPTKFMEGGSP